MIPLPDEIHTRSCFKGKLKRWNEDCRRARTKKVRTLKIYLKLKQRRSTVEEIKNAHKDMVSAKSACKKTIAAAKLAFWKASTQAKPGDITSAWRSLRILKSAYNPPDPDLQTADGQKLRTPQEKANGFLDHFLKASLTSSLPEASQEKRKN